jgi:hypothetical protein
MVRINISIHLRKKAVEFGRSVRYRSGMRSLTLGLLVSAWLTVGFPLHAGTGRVIKVLPEFLDLKGRTSLSPSLYERDAYQVVLRDHPQQRSGVRFFVQWKTKGGIWEPLKLKLEMRGTAQGKLPETMVLEQPLENTGGWFSHWASFTVDGRTYKALGSITAWRITLWEGEQLLGEQQSFLW